MNDEVWKLLGNVLLAAFLGTVGQLIRVVAGLNEIVPLRFSATDQSRGGMPTLFPRRVCSLFIAMILTLWIGSSMARAQELKAGGSSKPAAPAAATTDPTVQSKSANSLANAALNANAIEESAGDYVPCKFTYAQLQSLVIPERKSTLTGADAERFVESVIAETLNQQKTGLLDETTSQAIISSLDPSAIAGLTQSQALALVMRTLAVVRNTARVQNDLDKAEDAAQAKEKTDDSKKTIAGAASDAMTAMRQAIADKELLPRSAAMETTITAAKVRLGELDRLAGIDDPTMMALKSLGAQPSYAGIARADILSVEKLPATGLSASSTDKTAKPNPVPLDTRSSVTTSVENVTAAAGMIVGRAHSSLDLLTRPEDVGCAMSVLSAGETTRAYGRLVSNRYIAVQVVVRNLNRQQEFILHDAELAVNIDSTGLVGRFYSGRDKVVVRQISNAQQFFDARNIIVHLAEGIGAVMSSASIVFGGALVDATNVFNTGFYQSLSKGWRDMSVDQLNLLNDTGFSSQTNSQVVVPKTGSVMFVMFIPSKQFEQGWWTMPCAARSVLGSYADFEHREFIALTDKDKVTGAEPLAATGYDTLHALASCKQDPGKRKQWTYNPLPAIANHAHSEINVKTPIELSEEDINSLSAKTIAYPSASTPFSKWQPNALAIFQELSTAVVAGMHITDESALAPSLTSLDCDKDDKGFIKFPAKSTTDLSCPAAGKNLNKLKLLRLRNSKDPADPATVDGSVQPAAGDDTSATVTFPTVRLQDLASADYSVVMLTDANSSEIKTPVVIHLSTARNIDAPSIKPIDANSPPKIYALSGHHLDPDGVKSLIIKTSDSKLELLKAVAPVSTDNTLNFDAQKVTAAQWAALGKNDTQAALTLVLNDGTTLDLPAVAFTAPVVIEEQH